MRLQGSNPSVSTGKESNWTWQANLAVLAHSYADCGLWLSSLGASHKPWRWGSDYCAEQQLWGSLAGPMDVGQHQNNTTQHVTQTSHWWTNKTSMYLMPPCPGSKLCLVWHTVKEIRHTRPQAKHSFNGKARLRTHCNLSLWQLHWDACTHS